MIGIIGYGMVGSAVGHGFPKTTATIVDPKHTNTTIEQLSASNPEAVFVCVPTPDGDNFTIIQDTLRELRLYYDGLVIVKSTVPAKYIKPFNVVFNPEFLSRKTSLTDFTNPPFVVFGGDVKLCEQAIDIYKKYSAVDMSNTHIIDMETAALLKYTQNSFYALKVTFMNEVRSAADKIGADYQTLANIIGTNPWVGNYHLQVPGPDGECGFGGPCLPKDTRAFVEHYGSELLPVAIQLNRQFRGNDGY